LGDPNAIDALTEALFNPKGDEQLPNAVAKSLAKIQHPKALQTLLKAVNEVDENSITSWWIRDAALEALAERRDPEVIPVLVQALQDQNASVRTQAAIALQKHIHAHPDIILKLPPEDRNRLGQILQDQHHKELQDELCK